MKISSNMGFKTSCLVVLVIVICASAVKSSEEMEEDEKISNLLAHIFTGEMHKDKGEMLLIVCNLHFSLLKETVDELDMCLNEDGSYRINKINLECLSMAKENIWRLLSRLNSQAKKTLLDCLGMNNPLLSTFEEEKGSQVRYSKNAKALFTKPDIRRRNLGSRLLLQSIAEVPARSPFSSPEISPSPEPSSLFSPSQNPASSPNVPLSQPNPTDPLSEDVLGSPNSGANAASETKGKNHKPVIIAVVVTASVTFLVVALLFLCCTKFCKGGSRVRRNDERPLLSLSMSDFSVGSAPNFFTYGSSMKEEKLEHQSNISNQQNKYFDNHLHVESNVRTSVQEFQANEAFAGVNKSNIESLDMSGNINGPVMPTLKPPPGRIPVSSSSLLPPQPASSFKTPSNAGPSPHPPPARHQRPPSTPSLPVAPPPAPPMLPPSRPLVNSGCPPGPPPLPPPIPTGKAGPRAPPPPKSSGVPPRPPQPMSLGSNAARPSKPPLNPASSKGNPIEDDSDVPKAKLKPFFWDKVLANPGHSMVWHQIKSGSFQFNEEMIETLFGYAPIDKNRNERKKESSSQDSSTPYIQIIDSKKAQNLSILLRALNVTKEEICDAIIEGNELHAELIQNILKMAPTAEEELKLRLFNGEVSQLGLADRFLKALVNIPFAFKRLEALHFMCTLLEDVTAIKESFTSLEVACQELRNCRLFLKLLEAVLKTGNRMNDGTFRGGAQAFKLDTLLKLSDVKGTDGKTTLLLFVVQEIIRSEGARAARAGTKSNEAMDEASLDTEDHYRSLGLQVISGLGKELENVKRAAGIDLDGLKGTVAKLGQALLKTREFLNTEMKNIEENSDFHTTLNSFVQNAEVDITTLLEEEKRIMNLVKSTGDYFHGKTGKDEGLRLFLIVRDFLIMVDKACRELSEARRKTHKKAVSSPDICSPPSPATSSDLNLRLFPAIKDRRIDNSSSDEEGP